MHRFLPRQPTARRLRAAGLLSAMTILVAGCGSTPPSPRLPVLNASAAAKPAPDLIPAARYGRYPLIELVPEPAQRDLMQQVVEAHAERLWKGAAIAPLLTSFQPDALRAAQNEAPALPRGLLLDTLWSGWLETALTLDCIAVVCNQDLWDGSSVTQARSAGLRLLAYTVNDEWAAQRLTALGIDGIITDRVDLFAPAAG